MMALTGGYAKRLADVVSGRGIARPLAARPAALRAFGSDLGFEPKSPSPPDTQNAPCGAFAYLAERGGFEPPRRYKRLPDFESGTFNHSATSPGGPRRTGDAHHTRK